MRTSSFVGHFKPKKDALHLPTNASTLKGQGQQKIMVTIVIVSLCWSELVREEGTGMSFSVLYRLLHRDRTAPIPCQKHQPLPPTGEKDQNGGVLALPQTSFLIGKKSHLQLWTKQREPWVRVNWVRGVAMALVRFCERLNSRRILSFTVLFPHTRTIKSFSHRAGRII